jgi:hypothetical protein
MRTIRTDRARAAFLQVFSETCNVSEAARKANISRRAAYEWRDADASFAADWDEAEQVAVDKLEQVAWERATTGGSDRMLEILLKAHRSDKFVERNKVDVTVSGLSEAMRAAEKRISDGD